MRKYIIGFIIGAVIASVVTAYAAARFVLVDGGGTEITATNPLNITNS